MNPSRDEEQLREEGLLFFGKMTASLSHELNNVFAIVGELTGLLDDFMNAGESGDSLNIEKLKSVAERIAKQSKRGKTLIKRLNRFAHTTDRPVETLELTEYLELILDLCLRFASLKKVDLESDFPTENCTVETYPFGLLHSVFLCIDMALAAAADLRKVGLSFQVNDRGTNIIVASADPIAAGAIDETRVDFLRLLMKKLGGRVEGLPAENSGRFVLFFPGNFQPSTNRNEERTV